MYSIIDKRHSRPFKAKSCNPLSATPVGSLKSFEYGLKWPRDKIRHFDVLSEVIAGRKEKKRLNLNLNGVVKACRKRLPRPVCLVQIGRLVVAQLFFVIQTKSQSITYFYSLVNDTNSFNLRFPKRFSLHICFSVEMASNPEQRKER